MNSFLLNTLSTQTQFNTIDEAHKAIRDVVECLKYISPALSSKRQKLIVDMSLDHRDIVKGISVIQAINSLPKRTDRDIRTIWFLYTKKQATKANTDIVDVTIESTDHTCTQTISGKSTKDFLIAHSGIISFGGCELTKSTTLQIKSNGKTLTAENAHMLAHIRRLVPKYQPSPKHQKEAYYDHKRHEQVAAMPLPPDVAHEVLLAGLPHGNDYVGLHGPSGKFIRFKLTGGNEYHGFEVSDNEVPAALQNQLKPKR
jgi:hypothetical protein